MSEIETNIAAESPAPPLLPPPAVVALPEKTAGRTIWPVFFVLGFVILAGGEGYLWHLEQSIAGQATQLAVLQAQMDDMRAEAAKAAPAPDSVNVQADLAMKLSALAAQVNAVQAQTAADHGSLSTLQANSMDLTKLTARIGLLNQIETARMALDAGQPLGEIPNAPPALAQFAGTAPPTQSQLLLSFPEAARAAESASIAGDAKGSRWSQALARLESLITISNGSHMLLGAPAAGVIVQAQALLQAGDLAGAVAQLDTLSQSTQEAMGDWLVRARALVAARAAMISMAGED